VSVVKTHVVQTSFFVYSVSPWLFLLILSRGDRLGAEDLFDFLGFEAAGGGFVEDLSEPRADEFGAFALALSPRGGGHGEAGAADGFEDAVVLELAVSSRDGVRIDRQLAGELADARYKLARTQGRVGNREFHLPDDLVVDGQAVVRVDLKKHVRHSETKMAQQELRSPQFQCELYYRTSTVSGKNLKVKQFVTRVKMRESAAR
jgi:hypothetical protein